MLQTDVFVTILNDRSEQRSYVNAAILDEVLPLYKQANPQVSQVYLRSDQAGCYKSERLIIPIWLMRESHGISIKKYMFSEAGSGKSRCDQVSDT